MNKNRTLARWSLIGLLLTPALATAEPLSAPGDLRLRHDLQLLNDSGAMNIPLTAWPVSNGDIHAALMNVDPASLSPSARGAFERVHDYVSWELDSGFASYRLRAAAAAEPRVIRSFENTPREEGEVSAGFSWLGDRFVVNLVASYAANPFDDEEFRADGTYVGLALGNWMLTAGWQDRWWGPSRDGSLILGTNARPMPGVMLQRNVSTPFETRWLSWMGPWTMTTFMTQHGADPASNDELLFGVRGSFRPPRTGLEIGISRTAQWCGDGRPCDLGTFVDVVLGNDNRGVNVDVNEEPGNQMGGVDVRWKLPGRTPVALYAQWVGEDGRPGAGVLGSWLRQAGVEYWGQVGAMDHRTHFEASDTMCREGGLGFSNRKPDCSYRHALIPAGYRYLGRSLAHPADADSRSYSLGSTLLESTGNQWEVLLRHMQINLVERFDTGHSLYGNHHDVTDVQLSHKRLTDFGVFHVGFAYSSVTDKATQESTSESAGFIQWSSHW